MWRKAMLYLGLGPDEEYNGGAGLSTGPTGPVGAEHPRRPAETTSTQRRPTGTAQPQARPGAAVRQLPQQQDTAVPPRPAARAPTVRAVRSSTAAKPVVVAPTSFNEAQDVADHFRGDQPVIMNLQGLPRELSRRLIDFASGVCYGLGGQMERVAVDVFLLTPSKMEVSKEERRRLQQRGLHDT